MKLYGLYSTKQKKPVGFTTQKNDGDYCTDVSFELSASDFEDCPWCTPDVEVALRIIEHGPTPWYNAGYSSPMWDENYLGKLELVDLTLYEEG